MDKKLVYLFLAIGMTVVILAPIWPSQTAMEDIYIDVGTRTGLVVPCCGPGYDGDANVRGFETMRTVYGIVKGLFAFVSFLFVVCCVACIGTKQSWPHIALLVVVAIQFLFLVLALLASWDLFRFPGSLATLAIITIAAKMSYDELISSPSVLQVRT